MTLRVAHIIDSMAAGGAERLVLETVRFLNNQGQTENTIIFTMAGGPLREELEAAGIHYRLLTKTSVPGKIMELRAIAKELKVDVVHAHLLKSMLLTRLALPRKIKQVNTYHTPFHHKDSIEFSWKQLWMDRITYSSRISVLYVSNAVKSGIAPAIPITRNHKVLPNFVVGFEERYHFKPESSLRMVMVGNLREQKNYPLALEAMRNLGDPKVSLDIFGYGELNEELQHVITENQLNVRLMGKQTITSALLAGYDLFLMTSKHEGMPLALIEAIMTGVPALLNDIPELRETARDAAMYFERDRVDGLVGKVEEILANKGMLKVLSRNTQSLAYAYTVQHHMKELEKTYEFRLCVE